MVSTKQAGHTSTVVSMLVAGALGALLLTAQLGAQAVTGTWQGTLMLGGRPDPMVLEVSREGDGRLTAAVYHPGTADGFSSPTPAYAASFDGGVLKLTFGRASYAGTLTPDGGALTGTWTAAAGTAGALRFTRSTAAAAWRDTSAHRSHFVTVAPGVRLEVLDFGGPAAGRPVVLLAGLGNNAHVYDRFAPKLTDRYRVYAITRRGFAPSSVPASGYLADRLAEDVRAVLDSLRLRRPVLVGHSLAGQELSSIGSRRPERVAGLAYLDAGWQYAFHDPSVPDQATFIIPDVQRRLALIFDRWAPLSFAERAAMIRELADTTLPVLTRDLRLWAAELDEAPNPAMRLPGLRKDPVAAAIFEGQQRFTKIRGPVLALYVAPAAPRSGFARDSASVAKWDSLNLAVRLPQITAFKRGVPQARVVRLRHADHYVWRSHEAVVLSELRAFVDALPPAAP